MKRYINQFKVLFIGAVTMLSVYFVGQIGVAYIVKVLTDAVIENNQRQVLVIMGVASIYLVLLFLIAIIAKSLKALFINKASVALKQDLFKAIIVKNFEKYSKKDIKEYISLLNNDTLLIADNYFSSCIDIIAHGTQLTIAVALLIKINFILAIIAITVNFLPVFVPLLLGKKLSKSKEKLSIGMNNYLGKIRDFLTGFEVIKSFSIENKVMAEHSNACKQLERTRYKAKTLEEISFSLSYITSLFIFITIFVCAGYFVIEDSLELGIMLAVIQLLNYIVGPLGEISEKLALIKSIDEVDKNIKNIIFYNEIPKECDKIIKFNNQIILSGVNYRFSDEKEVLQNIDCVLSKGKKYAVVGNSGSGKSTLVKILAGHFENYGGDIYIDGLNVKEIDCKCLLKLTSIIHQSVFLFEDTVRQNIALYTNIDEMEIDRAIELAGLKKFISSLPMGMDTKIKDNGQNFSGGEMQRFAIARALIKNTPILVLDEATSSLDNEIAFKIEKTVLQMTDVTAFVVTHRLHQEMLKMYDEIIFLKEGKITEKGSFEELMNQKGDFYSLYKVFSS